jgi:hypothetical protein
MLFLLWQLFTCQKNGLPFFGTVCNIISVASDHYILANSTKAAALSKGDYIISKATEYITHLEKRNKYLQKENASLKSRVDAFEILIMSRQAPNNKQPQRNSINRQGGLSSGLSWIA